MSDLAILQARFGAALDAPGSEAGAAEMFRDDPAQVEDRLRLYRGNARANTVKALGAAYPIIGKIVGEEFFFGLASEYQSRCPSGSGDLNEFGEAFAAFLADFSHVKEMPYLPDVARMEWRVHRAHFAADQATFDPQRLVSVPPERQLQLRMRLHPACGILHSVYPLARIWQVHQDDYNGEFEVDLAAGPAHVLVSRPRFRVEVAQISEAEAAFLAAALEGRALEDSLAAAQFKDPSFDLGRSLRDWVDSAVIVDFAHAGG
jgi:hypothetical protein